MGRVWWRCWTPWAYIGGCVIVSMATWSSLNHGASLSEIKNAAYIKGHADGQYAAKRFLDRVDKDLAGCIAPATILVGDSIYSMTDTGSLAYRLACQAARSEAIESAYANYVRTVISGPRYMDRRPSGRFKYNGNSTKK